MVYNVNYEAIFQCAHEIANQRMRSGEPISQDDTVCVICAGSGKMYSGINRRETSGSVPRNIHAEEEAIRNMQAAGEAVIQALLLISVANGMRMLPCDECMRKVLALHPDNIRCEILMPDRAVPLSEFSRKLSAAVHTPVNPVAKPEVHQVPSVSVPLPQGVGSDAALLKSKVNDLLGVTEEEEEEEEEVTLRSILGGFFKKK